MLRGVVGESREPKWSHWSYGNGVLFFGVCVGYRPVTILEMLGQGESTTILGYSWMPGRR